jgi:hypothetical protein
MTPSGLRERGLLISHLHDQFWSEEYYRAAQLVRRWKEERGGDWAAALFVGVEEEREMQNARRLIKSYFRKTQQLCARGFLEPDDLREHLTMPQRLQMLFEIIEPFERARKKDYDREMFDFYDELHAGKLERPAR